MWTEECVCTRSPSCSCVQLCYANVHVHHGPDVCVVSEQEDRKLNRRQNKDGGFDWMIKATARDQRVNWKSEQFQDLKLILSDLSLRNRVT